MSDVYLGEGKLKDGFQDGSNKMQPEHLSEPAALEDELKKGLKDHVPYCAAYSWRSD